MPSSPNRALLVAMSLWLGASLHPSPSQASDGNALESSMGGIEWGWSPKQVYKHLKEEVGARYRESIAKSTDAIEEDRLRHQMNEELRQIRDSFFEFDGTPSAYDSGYLRGEFTHENQEALLRVRTANSQDFFFFIEGKLWKRYRAFNTSVFEGASFSEFGDALQQRYGKAVTKTGSPTPGATPTQWYQWSERSITARAVDNNEFYGFYCLVLEDPRTVARLGSLRKNEHKAGPATTSVVGLVEAQDGADPNADIADRISGEIRRREAPELDSSESK